MKPMRSTRAGLWALAGAAALGSSVAVDDAKADDYPPDRITFIVPSAPGGGMDRLARQIQPYAEERLGANLVVNNRPGGAFAVGTTAAYQAAGDCTTLLVTFEPQHALTWLTQDVPYDGDSFMPLVSMVQSNAVLYVKNDAPWETIQDLIEDAQERPGEIRMGASTATDPGYYSAEALMAATGVEFNLIPYHGGTEFRNAFRGDEVTVASDDTFAGIGLKDEARLLAAFTGSDEPLPAERNPWSGEDVPSINAELGADIPASFATTGSVYVKRECYEDHPERYEVLMDAFLEATEDPRYHDDLREVDELDKLVVVPGPEYHEIAQAELEALLPILRELGVGS